MCRHPEPLLQMLSKLHADTALLLYKIRVRTGGEISIDLSQRAKYAERAEGLQNLIHLYRPSTGGQDIPTWANRRQALLDNLRLARRTILAQIPVLTFIGDDEKASQSPTRLKQQKFQILDSPSLLRSDLDECRASDGFGVAMIYLDIDLFKKLNTELTERVVDRTILRPIHEYIHRSTRGLGFSYAEGGDEFVTLLPNANEEIALAVAEALRVGLSLLRFDADGRQYSITASLGVATTPEWTIDELGDAANKAENRAKKEGRDRVAVARRSSEGSLDP